MQSISLWTITRVDDFEIHKWLQTMKTHWRPLLDGAWRIEHAERVNSICRPFIDQMQCWRWEDFESCKRDQTEFDLQNRLDYIIGLWDSKKWWCLLSEMNFKWSCFFNSGSHFQATLWRDLNQESLRMKWFTMKNLSMKWDQISRVGGDSCMSVLNITRHWKLPKKRTR